MICVKCLTEFEPKPARRKVCASCIAGRPAHLRDYINTAASNAAKVKRKRLQGPYSRFLRQGGIAA